MLVKKPHIKEAGIVLIFEIFAVITILLGCSISFLMLLSVLICAIALIYLKFDDAYAFMFFILPFANIFKLNPQASSFFTYLGLLLAVRIIISFKKIEKWFLFWTVIYSVFVVIGCYGDFTIIIKQMIMPVLLYGFYNLTDASPKKILCNWTVGSIIAATVALFHKYIPSVSKFLNEIRVLETNTEMMRFAGLYRDPNYFSATLILLILGTWFLITKKEIGYKWYIPSAILVVFGCMTLSKSFYLMLTILYLLCIVFTLKQKKYIYSFSMLLVGALLITLLLLYKKDIFEVLFLRFNSGDWSTGRTDIWDNYINHFLKYPWIALIGSGIGNSVLNGYATHNLFLDFIYFYGLFGTFIYISFICSVLRYKGCKDHKNAIILLSFMALAFFLSYLHTFDFPYLLIFVFSFLTMQNKTNTI